MYLKLYYTNMFITFLCTYGIDTELAVRGPPTIETLLPYVGKLSSKLLPLGIVLGVKDYVLSIHSGELTPQDKCILILNKWLEITKNPTWTEFCNKLKQPGLDMTQLAKEIAKDQCP